MKSAYPARNASLCTALAMTAEKELAMSGTMRPTFPVRPRASDRATGFGL